MLSTIFTLLLAANVTYHSPVDYEILLAGNFGEPRPHHFHGGIDVKTDGREGKHIYSIGDGYVSRITVGINGFGNAVYVTHPEGYTSIYCHLKCFSPRIQRAWEEWKEKSGKSEGEVKFKPTDMPVAQGQLIALSGNTGFSTAPHLHLEIHDTKTWNMRDPLIFLGHLISDNTPPQAHGFNVYPQEGEGVFNGSSSKQTFGFSSHELTDTFYAWGKVGFALWADDYMEGTHNHFGIRETHLMVDGRSVFHSNVDGIPTNQNRMVNSWGDYCHWRTRKVWYMKSFIEPGNRLPILMADENRGIVDFNEQRDYQIEYQLSDYFGNVSTYRFTVKGERREIPKAKPRDPLLTMRWNQTNLFSRPGMQLIVRQGLLGDDVELEPVVREQPGKLSPAYSFASFSTPLFDWAEISIAPRRNVADPSKLYITDSYGHNLGGTYKDGWVTGRMRDLGETYQLAYDGEQ